MFLGVRETNKVVHVPNVTFDRQSILNVVVQHIQVEVRKILAGQVSYGNPHALLKAWSGMVYDQIQKVQESVIADDSTESTLQYVVVNAIKEFSDITFKEETT